MPFLNEDILNAFRENLKTAAPDWKRLAGGAAGGAGLGALVGGVGGAIHGGYKAHQQGESTFGGALHGVTRGAGLGALAGGAIGAATPQTIQSLAKADHIGGSAVRAGQAQLHGITGWTPEGGIDALHGAVHDARKAVQKATPEHAAQAAKGLSAAQASQDMGLSNLPGYARAIKEHGIGKVLKTDLASTWHSGGMGRKALAFGLPAAGLAHDVASKENPEGPGKGEQIGRGVAGALGGVLGGSMPLSGQLLMGSALSHAGGLAGRGIDRLRGRRPVHGLPDPEQQGEHVSAERIMSPAAMGQPPEGVPS